MDNENQGSIVERGEYKGKPFLILKRSEEDKYPFSFGVSKAKLILDTFGDKPQCLSLGKESRKPEGLIKAGGLSLSVSTLSIPEIEYSKQTPMLAIGVYECVDNIEEIKKFVEENADN